MSEPLVCGNCPHTDDQHHDVLGYCEAKNCPCVCFRTEDEVAEDAELDIEDELDFDTEEGL